MGSQGPPGATGPQGHIGPPGANGIDGATDITANPTLLNGGALARMSPSTVGISPYSCVDSTGAVWIRMPGPANMVKDMTQPWGRGNAGGMGIGVIQAPNTWYHVFAIMNGGSADAFFDSNVAGGNAPAGTTARRRIGSILTNAANQIFNFQQNGDMVTWCPLGTDIIQIIDQTLAAGAAQATSFRNTLAPPGVQTISLLNGNVTILTATGAQNFQAVMYPTVMGSFTTTSFGGFISVDAIGQGGIAAFDMQVLTDINQLIGLGWAATAGSTHIHINCRGYIDTRGKL